MDDYPNNYLSKKIFVILSIDKEKAISVTSDNFDSY